ncbi:glycosyl transferase family 2 [Pseudomarimonas salicorniae]|uniref:Glycosyl transferase family 2 n=1 Tax=Pseudomarimonas salicorniae TaxID=2933270 RepID=A0ABT0GKN8_9GAMM|nr:glycosyl transferase family 2 [Lysobacter sp. CAU 1642]MCK7595106.1 glycosyl transferase family 2 [Lysobacter sp. CAU 1642]
MPRLDDLCVVVPVGPGDVAWRRLLPQLEALPETAEIIFSGVDGDPGAPAAQALPGLERCLCLAGPAGRAAQQNRGAAAGRNGWLWFLHADSRLHPRALARIATLPDRPALAYFDLAFDDGPRGMPINRLGAFIRSRWLRMPFGDQGLLLPRRQFEALGGFDETVGPGEDHALVWKARRAGLPLHPLGVPLYTSARRYAEHGWLRTTARHLRMTFEQARRFSGGGA